MAGDSKADFFKLISAREGQKELEEMEQETAEEQPKFTGDPADLTKLAEPEPEQEVEPESTEEEESEAEEAQEAPAPVPSETNRKFMQMVREKPARNRKYLGRRTRY